MINPQNPLRIADLFIEKTPSFRRALIPINNYSRRHRLHLKLKIQFHEKMICHFLCALPQYLIPSAFFLVE